MAASSNFAGVIVVTPDNGVILQVRDDNPAIKDPGKLSIFAGRMKEGESPLAAAIRELEEETTVQARPEELEFFVAYQKDVVRHGDNNISNIFIVRDVEVESVHIHEGQGYRVVHDASDVTEENCALISYDILQEYFRLASH
jgi:8-oxo-dGTP diphosphatase